MSTCQRTHPTPIKDISCQDLLMYSDNSMCGYLRRRSTFAKILDDVAKKSQIIRWPNMYVVLRQGCLYIFKDERASSAVKSVSLYGFSHVSACDSNDVCGHALTGTFKLISDLDLRDRVFYFCAPTSRDMDQWIVAIQREMQTANNNPCGTDAFAESDATDHLPARRRGAGVVHARRLPVPPTDDRTHLPAPAAKTSQPTTRKFCPAPPPQKGPPIQLDYEMGDFFDSDYEQIEDSTDDENETGIGTNQTDALKASINSSSSSSRTADLPDSDTPVAKKPPPPAPPVKPMLVHSESKPAAPPKPTLSNKSQPSSPLLPVLQSPTAVITDGYSVERKTDDDVIDESISMYCGTDEYLPSKAPTNKKVASGVDPLVSNATWNGPAAEGERFMKTLKAEGVYMIRASSKGVGQGETLLVRIGNEVRKYRITFDEEGQFYLEKVGPHFDTRTEMIRYYRTNNLPCHSVKLTKPFVDYMRK